MFIAGRRSRHTVFAALLVAVVLFAGCGWPQSGYGPEHTGFNPFETTISAANVSGLQVRWSATVGDGRPKEASPAIADGVLYVTTDKLYAFDASTGSARWSVPGIWDWASGPVVDTGVVYVNAIKDGRFTLHVFDAGSGRARWSRELGDSGGYPATVADGVVYVGGDKLYAFNAKTGSPLWSAAGIGRAFSGSPAVAGGVVYAGADKVYAFDAKTGAQLWSAATGGYIYSSPAVANGVVYIGNEHLYAFNATTGTQLWYSASETGYGSPSVANGVVYAGAENLLALNATTGAQLWSVATGTDDGSAAVANGVVYVANVGHQHAHAYHATTGRELWSGTTAVGGSSPVVANGVVYFNAEKLYAYSLPITTPQLVISPAFPDQYVFGDPSSTARTFTITNIGSMPTSRIASSLSGPDAAHFRLTSDGCAGTSLAGGASCSVTASFAPTSSGPRTARLTATAAAGGTVSALLAGTAQPLTISPSLKDFGGVFAGSTSAAVFTVTNLSTAPIGPVTNSITEGSGFSITTDGCAGKILAAGTRCTIAVTFTPTPGTSDAGRLDTQAPGHQAEASLSGRRLSQLSIGPSGKDFGQVRAGTTASATFTVTNISPTPAGPITGAIGPALFDLHRDWYTITSGTCAGRTLAAGASCSVVVTFAPTSATFANAQLAMSAPTGGSGASLIGWGL